MNIAVRSRARRTLCSREPEYLLVTLPECDQNLNGVGRSFPLRTTTCRPAGRQGYVLSRSGFPHDRVLHFATRHCRRSLLTCSSERLDRTSVTSLQHFQLRAGCGNTVTILDQCQWQHEPFHNGGRWQVARTIRRSCFDCIQWCRSGPRFLYRF